MIDHPNPVETLAKWMQAIVAADRWKGRDLSAEPPQKWKNLRQEVQQVWLDEARALLAQIGPALVAEAVAQERKRWEAMSMVDFANQSTGRSIAAIRARTP